jgi:hypothetical chaperone protein
MEYLGVDFGTTNTLAGIVDHNKKLQLVPLDGESQEMPSAIFLKIRDKQRLLLNEDSLTRRVEEAIKRDKARFENAISSIPNRLEDFRRANRPRLKAPKPYDFVNSDKYNKALNAFLRDKNDYDRILQNFEDTKVADEEINLRQSIQPLINIDSLRNEVRAKMEQELMDEEMESMEGKTFFTALNDPATVRFFGQSAIDEYKNNPMNGFFMRSPKAFLGISLHDVHKQLFVQIVALVLAEIKRRSEAYFGKEFTGVVLGRPVNYMGAQSSSDNEQALGIMRKAAQLAGFTDIHFVIEPMAASLVISRAMFDSSAPAVVIDIGGGTTDIILLNVNSEADEKLNVLNAVGERVGGNDFDEILAKKKFGPFLGANSESRDGKKLPNHLIMDALSTRDIHKQANFRKRGIEIHEYISQADEPLPLERLYQLFRMQLQHQILLISEDAKKALSDIDTYEAQFPFFDDPFRVDLRKTDLADIYENELNIIKRNILSVFKGHLAEGQAYRVFLTGGMSRCTTLIESIKELIPAGVVINRIAALQSVGAGLAVVARQLALSDDAYAENFSVRGIPVTR